MTDNLIHKNDNILGYKVLRKEELPFIKGYFFELIHERTNARHIHISCDDSENVFGVAFKTVPKDSTGVAHILEHTALCGSKNYPVRDPFFSMIKRSLNTFMNAFTASDWTMYPFATQNEKDFYNLMGVYLDAAFFPNLDELSFMQEGHRLSIDQNGELTFQGVVYNEMKGAMSSESQVMGRNLLNALYPDTTYGFNSGGEPSVIPSLTHEDLINFHKTHYHPSNAYFFTYGNLDIKKHLEFIEKNILSGFDKIDPGTDVPNQTRWSEPVRKEYSYAVEGENTDKKAQIAVGWLTADIRDSYDCLVLSLLDQILLGNSAAPLYKALIDSGIGSALSDVTGFDADNKDTMFAAGLKEVKIDDAEKIENLILRTLEEIVEKGIDQELIDTAVHQFEFHKKEITNTPMPYGLKMLLSIGSTWFHGGDSLNIILFDEELKKIVKEAKDKRLFESYIKKFMLDNKHRVTLILKPDPDKAKETAKKEKEELKNIMSSLSKEELKSIENKERELVSLQDKDEDLSVLPSLEITDIKKEINTDAPSKVKNNSIYFYDKPTSDIFYFTGIFKVGHLPHELLELVPIFSFLVSRMGTKKRDYVEFTRKIDAVTGGFGLSSQVRNPFDTKLEPLPFVSFSSKCLNRNQDEMFHLVMELLKEYSFDDSERLTKLLMQLKSGIESSIVQNGHKHAISIASKKMSKSSALSSLWGGINQLQILKDLLSDIESKGNESSLDNFKSKMMEIAHLVFGRANSKFCLVGDSSALEKSEKLVEKVKSILNEGIDTGIDPQNGIPEQSHVMEAWTTNTSVSFVGTALKVPSFGDVEAPFFSIAARLLKSCFLHREIREKGGAYGGFSLYNSEDGIFNCGSYRDPHIKRTLETFMQCGEFLSSDEFDESDIKEAILQTAADLEKPDTPAVSAKKDFFRKILGIPDEARKNFKSKLLEVNIEDIKAIGEKYFLKDKIAENFAVITSRKKLEEEKMEQSTKELKIFKI